MCGRSTIARSSRGTRDAGFRPGLFRAAPDATSSPPDPSEEKISPRARIVSAMSILTPVALSGVFLVVFVPQLWWIFTTYFWIAFPALGSLRRGLVDAIDERPRRVSEGDVERELLVALGRHGELTSVLAAAETSLSVAEADSRLGDLAHGGHLEVRARGGAIFYALWDSEPRGRRLQPAREDLS